MHKKSFFAGISGNVIEHYDSALYAMLAPFLAPLFFPGDPLQSLIFTYAIMPLGMLSKPFGSLVFGYIGDRYGRKTALFYSLLGMALTTTFMGFLPTFVSAGYFAPILLALGRITQKFFASGEIIGGAIFVLEHSSKKEKSFLSSLYDCTSILGILLASFAVMLLSSMNWIEPGWRILFLLGSSAGWLGLIIRNQTEEPEVFVKKTQKSFFLKHYPKEFCAIIFVSGLSYAIYAFSTTFFNAYLPLVSDLTKTEVMKMSTTILVFDLLALPLFGFLAEKFSKEKIMMISSILAMTLAIPLFYSMKNASFLTATSIRMIFVVIGVSFSAPFHFWATELIPSEHRYLAVSLGYAIGSQTIGASATVISLWLYQKTGWVAAPAMYLFTFSAVATLFIYELARKRQKALKESLL